MVFFRHKRCLDSISHLEFRWKRKPTRLPPVFGFVYLQGSASHKAAGPALPALFWLPPSRAAVSPPKPPGQTRPGVSASAARTGSWRGDASHQGPWRSLALLTQTPAGGPRGVRCGRWFRRCGTERSSRRSCALRLLRHGDATSTARTPGSGEVTPIGRAHRVARVPPASQRLLVLIGRLQKRREGGLGRWVASCRKRR